MIETSDDNVSARRDSYVAVGGTRILVVAVTTLLLAGVAAPSLAQQSWEQEFRALRQVVEDQQRVIDHQAASLRDQLVRIDRLENAKHPAGYDGGFVIADSGEKPATKDTPFQMNIGTWGQLRHNYFDSDGPNPDENDIDLERLRLVFSGHAFNSNFQYFFQLDADSDARETVDMLDYYLTYDFGKDLFCWNQNRLRLRLGKWKIGFNRAREESGTRMQFSDRATSSVLFDFDRSLGIGLLGNVGPLDWQVTVANGIDTGGFQTSRSGELDRNMAVATRVNWLVMGDWGSDGHADLDWRCKPALRLGSGFTHARRDREGIREFNFPRVVDTGATIDTVLPAMVTAYDQSMFSADLNLKYRGSSFIFEYYLREFSNFAGAAVPALRDHGYWAELGYFVIPAHVQLIVRHARIVGDSGTLGLNDQSADEVAGGIVVYAKGHDLKLTFDVTHLNGAPVNDSALSIRPGDAGWLCRTTFQWKF